MAAATTAAPVQAATERTRPLSDRRTVTLAGLYYLLAAFALTLWLWRDPATRTVAGNPNDADQFAWFFRYDATAIAHFHLPALVTTAMNAPQGVNVMWNTPLLLPGVLLAPVTLICGPQVSLTLLLTAGFAGSATAMFAVLRRWHVGGPGAALGAAVYGFSPALVHSAIGHYDLQFVVLPPLIVDAVLRLATGRTSAPGQTQTLRGGLVLGLLVTAQLFISEEILFGTGLAAALLLAVLAASRPRTVPRRLTTLTRGVAIAAGVLVVLAGYPLWVQFFGPLQQHGSPFTTDFFKNDLSGFVVPSSYLLFHTAGSAAQAQRFQGLLPEYLGYLGWPLIVVLTAGAIAFWRRLPVRACAVACSILLLFSLGGTLLASGHEHPWLKLPWYWLQGLPVLSAALPDRFSIVADGAAGALLAYCVDAAIPVLAGFAARRLPRARMACGARPAAVVVACAALAVLPIVPRPLPAVAAISVPPGWSAAFGRLDLPASATVLAVPVPMSTFTEPLRWQADTGRPRTLVGGYFMGPAGDGHATTDGSGLSQAGRYLNILWSQSLAGLPVALTGGVPSSAHPGSPDYVRIEAVSDGVMRGQIAAWHASAVVAVALPDSVLGKYLIGLLGPPAVSTGDVMAWRTS